MTVSAEMYIVISLMFAVFAAVAAVGSSLVLGVGFERLRSGFELVKKQTGFFADAIHKLDERTNELGEENQEIKKAVAGVTDRVNSVEKQTSFFFDSLNSLESQILKGQPIKTEEPVADEPVVTAVAEPKKPARKARKDSRLPIWPNAMEWNGTSETRELLQANEDIAPAMEAAIEEETQHGLTSSFVTYLFSDNSPTSEKNVVYH